MHIVCGRGVRSLDLQLHLNSDKELALEHGKFVDAMNRYDSGERPYRFVTPNWFIAMQDGRTYPLKYLYAMAVGTDPLELHTDSAKAAASVAGLTYFNRKESAQPEVSSRYWWVNHKQTFKAETDGGYIWSPKFSQGGGINQTYANLTRTRPGDTIISYAYAEIRAIGVVVADHQEHEKPVAFGASGENWSSIGWLVSVEWTFLRNPLSPKNFIDQIAPLLPSKNSPLQANGNGNQGCYLASISSELGRLIQDFAESDEIVAEYLKSIRARALDDLAQSQILQSSQISNTVKEQVVKARVGQGVFRSRVLAQEDACRISKVKDPGFLVASHIKPWRHCTNEERLDGSNGLMLAPHVDRLFDSGLITFEDNGKVMVLDRARPLLEAWGLTSVTGVGPFTAKQAHYLKYHRTSVFGR